MSNARRPAAAKTTPARKPRTTGANNTKVGIDYTPTLSPETAGFLLALVNAQTITVNSPEFESSVVLVLRARQELTAILGPQAAQPADA